MTEKTEQERKQKLDPLNEYKAHDAARYREQRISGRSSGGKRL